MTAKAYKPRLIVLELTRRCILSCMHCRASAGTDQCNGEMSTAEWLNVLDDIVSFSTPIIILSGGEPLLRPDVFDVIAHGKKRGLVMTLSTCGVGLTAETARRLKEAGIKRVSVSLDGSDAAAHDFVRQREGAYQEAMETIDLLKKNEIEFQINTTVMKINFQQIEDIYALAVRLGAASFHPFFLVPVGRAKNSQDARLSPSEYEWTLEKLCELSRRSPIHCRPICAPHYFRILSRSEIPRSPSALDALSAGCLGGKSFAFISSTGKVKICGFLDVECGDAREESFSRIWRNSSVFRNIRDIGKYKGKCRACDYSDVCGGCRARAYEDTGDYMEEEPDCAYQPLTAKS